jgi:protein involved in polysaccharide export with SLBB domain
MKLQWQIAREASFLLGLIFIVGLLGSGCQTLKKAFTFSPIPDDGSQSLDDSTNRYAVGDLITVRFPGTIDPIPEYHERIKEDGTITLPLIGTVKAAGKTPAELQGEIHDLYVPRFYKDLTIPPPERQRVYSVGGQVRSPGRQVYIGATTVLKAIESAGGFTEYASRRRVMLTRVDGKAFIVDCKKAATDSSLDHPVYPGDKINVPMGVSRDIYRK